MRSSDAASSFWAKESEVQYGEETSAASRPNGSASGSRGPFSCRRWRLLSGKPSKANAVLDPTVPTGKLGLLAADSGVQRPTIADVDSKNWASAATPFAAYLPRETIVPTISRKSVAAVVLTSARPPENVKKWDREMTICERRHVKAMGRMVTRTYRGKTVGEERSEPSQRRKYREKQTLKDQIYLPTLRQARTVLPRAQAPPRRDVSSPQSAENENELPSALSGMKLLSSQFNELRARLDITTVYESGQTKTLRHRQTQRATMATHCRPSQPFRITTHKVGQPDTGSSSSSLETVLLRVLERPPVCSDGYQADQEVSTKDSYDETKTKSMDSRSMNSSEDDLLFLLSALNSTSQASSQDNFSNPSTITSPSLSSSTPSDFTAASDESC
ncbi:unnamed protein product [Phytophthora fragariaefolia]|uniref:Unnamed protein product n=1 Tax=Phytophthora fragariaefolia TaxID=1490495 RepID=A0A9W6UF03_9STRA|nr:unnamed protein product [Phytophthora fragariaefolia]